MSATAGKDPENITASEISQTQKATLRALHRYETSSVGKPREAEDGLAVI